jgi:hypothetical protein
MQRIARRRAADHPVLGPQVQRDGAAGAEVGTGAGRAAQALVAAAEPVVAIGHRPQPVDLADEAGHERRRRLAIDLQWRADLLDHALVHHHDAIGHRQRLLLVVGDHDGRHAEPALQRADLVAQVDPHRGVERRQRLVQQQQPGRGGERARQRDALLLAARELRREAAAAARQAHQAEQLVDARGDPGPSLAPVHQAIRHVLRHRQVGEQRIRLEHDPVVASRRRRHRDVPPGLHDAPGALRLQPGDDAQQGRLAAARRAQEADELALADRQVDAAERIEGAEALADAAEREVGVVAHGCLRASLLPS